MYWEEISEAWRDRMALLRKVQSWLTLRAYPTVLSKLSLGVLVRNSRRAVPFQSGLRVYSIAPVTEVASF